jgi:cytochrome oxidase Cu insertion factor (SCO1/SenC/PrrC family)
VGKIPRKRISINRRCFATPATKVYFPRRNQSAKNLKGGKCMLKVGDPAPDFTVKAHSGEDVTLSALKGHRVILWFYPKADTPG